MTKLSRFSGLAICKGPNEGLQRQTFQAMKGKSRDLQKPQNNNK